MSDSKTTRPRLGRGSRRGLWAVAAVAIDALGNLVFTIWMAREVAAVEFGAFAICYAIYHVSSGLSEGAGTMTLMVRHGASDRRLTRRAAEDVLGVTFAAAIVPVGIFLGLWVAVDGAIGQMALAFAAIVPGLLLQASVTQLFYARTTPQWGLFNTTVWTASQIPLLVVVPGALGRHHASSYVIAWGLAALIAVLVSLFQLRVVPRPDRVRDWVAEHRSTIRDLVADGTFGRLSGQGSNLVLGAVAGLRVIAGFRAGQIAYGLARPFIMGLAPAGLAEGIRLWSQSPARFSLLIRGWAVANATLCLLIGGALLLLPDRYGREIAGASWSHADDLLVAIIVNSVANAIMVPSQTGLRALGSTRAAALVRTTTAPLPSLTTLLGGLWGGGYYAVLGMALGSLASTLISFLTFETELRRASRSREETS